MKRLIFAALLTATPAFAATQASPDMVLIPRAVAEAAMEQIRHPNLMNNIDIYAAFQACVADNPHDGANMRMGPDQCPAVTAALAERTKRIADLTKSADAPKKEAVSTKPTKHATP